MKEIVKQIPEKSGVYIMKGKYGEILYVGKAKNLKKRVSSYFAKEIFSPRISSLIFEVKKIEYIETANEKEALILENELIKYLRPKYNIRLRDDKTYPYLKLTLNEEYPRLEFTRRKTEDGSFYLGPYPDAGSLKNFLRFLGRIYPLAKCSKTKFNKFKKIGNPSACLYWHIKSCVAPCSGKVSEEEYRKIVDELIKFLKEPRIERLMENWKKEMEEAVSNLEFERASEYKKRIEIFENLSKRINFYRVEKQKYLAIGEEGALTELSRIFKLPAPPLRIEGIDISNIMGKEAVGSVVVFENGMPKRSKYRRYKIKFTEEINDTIMVYEVVKRRFRRLKEEKDFPDLLLIDGGKGQISLALRALNEIGIENFPVCGLSKSEEKIYFYRWKEPIILPGSSPALKLLQQIRDEAHRFAHSYHILRRKKKFLN